MVSSRLGRKTIYWWLLLEILIVSIIKCNRIGTMFVFCYVDLGMYYYHTILPKLPGIGYTYECVYSKERKLHDHIQLGLSC